MALWKSAAKMLDIMVPSLSKKLNAELFKVALSVDVFSPIVWLIECSLLDLLLCLYIIFNIICSYVYLFCNVMFQVIQLKGFTSFFILFYYSDDLFCSKSVCRWSILVRSQRNATKKTISQVLQRLSLSLLHSHNPQCVLLL